MLVIPKLPNVNLAEVQSHPELLRYYKHLFDWELYSKAIKPFFLTHSNT